MILKYSRSFKKDYKKLNLKLRRQCDERIILFQENIFNPVLNNHATHYPYEGCHSINITGDIRALYEEIGGTIFFTRIGSHSELYK